ncbi:DUF6153 family protein [Arthrobacter rhizosphaerae]|uniref:DUF6153 family protein n=1 Tax=Arthrobacter rhizosphaerae TaxID=2855490 RepID=UPI001FF1C96E|nr:DUF6153 family protein [Arthrobacter rhizosphaerae]
MSRNMTGNAMAFLRKIGLFAAVLSIIAGIFGMHVISPAHSAQHQTPAHQLAASQHDASAHAHAAVPDMAAAWSMEQCSCSGDCTSMDATPASCTLSTNTTSLAAPFPGSTWVGVNTNARGVNLATAHWAFHPSSPSPGELSISRT